MAKKKKAATPPSKEFNRSPFSDLKGFAASGLGKKELKPSAPTESSEGIFGSFTEEMKMLGVQRLHRDPLDEEASPENPIPPEDSKAKVEERTDDDIFLAAMNDLQVRFEDHLVDADSRSSALPRRMKQLKQGKLTPDASLDLHGFQRVEVADKMRYFLQNARHQGWKTLLVITGKGLHSEGGEAVLRNEVERFLSAEGKQPVAEWGRAPKQYGGDGALVLFLRNNID